MQITKEILYGILDAYVYEIIFVDRNHTVCYMNKTAKQRYGDRVQVGKSLFNSFFSLNNIRHIVEGNSLYVVGALYRGKHFGHSKRLAAMFFLTSIR